MPEIQNCNDFKQANMQWSSFIFHEEVWGNLELNSPMLMWQLDFAKYMDTQTFPSVHEWIIILYFFFSPLCLHSKLQEGTTHKKGGQGVHNCCLLRNVLVPCDSCPAIFHWPKSGYWSARNLDHVILVWWLTCTANYTKSRYYELLLNNSSQYTKSPQ